MTLPSLKPFNYDVLEGLYSSHLQFLVLQERETVQKYLSESMELSHEPTCLFNQSAVTINRRLRPSE